MTSSEPASEGVTGFSAGAYASSMAAMSSSVTITSSTSFSTKKAVLMSPNTLWEKN